MYPDSSKNLNKETAKAVYFFTTAFAPLDNFSAHKINIWGREFATVEHAYQWKKFVDVSKNVADKIFDAKSPEEAKNIADKNKTKVAGDWYDKRVVIMREILLEKFRQHKDVKEILKKTKNRLIIENSPVDDFWGISKNGRGQNMIGKIWMEIRDSRLKM